MLITSSSRSPCSDEFGNNTQVSEIEYYGYELHKLEKLLEEYVYNEEYEKAAVILSKLQSIKSRLRKENYD